MVALFDCCREKVKERGDIMEVAFNPVSEDSSLIFYFGAKAGFGV